METVRVSSKGQIVIPKSLRTAFHIEAGSELAIFVEGDAIHLRQAEQRFARTDIAAGLGLLAKRGVRRRRMPRSSAPKPFRPSRCVPDIHTARKWPQRFET